VAAACGGWAPRLDALDARRRLALHDALEHVECLVLELPRRPLMPALEAWAKS
jgi:hypothetical protein